MLSINKKIFWFLLSLIIVVLDQWTKFLAQTYLFPHQPKPLFYMANFTLAYNTGAAFSFLDQAGNWHNWFFLGFSILMTLVLTFWLLVLPKTAKLNLLALSLLLGGAAGNLIDRITLGMVVDFIDLYYKSYHWPIFNIADASICLGAFFLLLGLHKQE